MNSLFQLVEYIELIGSISSTNNVFYITQSKKYFVYKDEYDISLYHTGKRKPILIIGDQWIKSSLDISSYPSEFISQKEYQIAKEMDEFQLILTYGKGVSVDPKMLEDIRVYVENL